MVGKFLDRQTRIEALAGERPIGGHVFPGILQRTQNETGLAHAEFGAIFQRHLRHFETKNERAIRAAQIAQQTTGWREADFAVPPGDGGIVEDDIIIRIGPDERMVFVQDEFPPLECSTQYQELSVPSNGGILLGWENMERLIKLTFVRLTRTTLANLFGLMGSVLKHFVSPFFQL
ncbi:MAG: hypothetical protein NTY53_19295 [Kiritimatiellaeota bacterium]|nr:hypothetical protein [Kiritimatiellota bacterium]